MRWTIYYDDETTFSSDDGSWLDAPSQGVQIIMDYMEKTPLSHMGCDYYLMRDDTIISFSEVHLHSHLELGIAPQTIKFGRWTNNKNWHRIHDRVFGVAGAASNPRG